MADKITNIADITKFTDGDGNTVTDRDSQENNVNIPSDLPGYKDDEIGKDYVPGQQDDDDFEKLKIKEFDLALRKFITKVNNTEIKSRIPQVDTTPLKNGTGTTAIYNHSKEPVKVSLGAVVEYTIRVYNEAEIDGYVEEIKNEEGKASAYPEIQVIQKKASTDENVNINMEYFGLDLSKVPNQNMGDITVYIIPVLYIITSFISIKITNGKKKKNKTLQIEEKTSKDKVNVEDGKNENDESLEAMQEMNNSMMYMVPIMSISIAFIAPLGLALYWLVSNILIIIERFIIDKIFNKEEEKNA